MGNEGASELPFTLAPYSIRRLAQLDGCANGSQLSPDYTRWTVCTKESVRESLNRQQGHRTNMPFSVQLNVMRACLI